LSGPESVRNACRYGASNGFLKFFAFKNTVSVLFISWYCIQKSMLYNPKSVSLGKSWGNGSRLTVEDLPI
jgi:hypothetical protein